MMGGAGMPDLSGLKSTGSEPSLNLNHPLDLNRP